MQDPNWLLSDYLPGYDRSEGLAHPLFQDADVKWLLEEGRLVDLWIYVTAHEKHLYFGPLNENLRS